jgi:hypothetical protein
MIFSNSQPWSLGRLAVLHWIASQHPQQFSEDILVGTAQHSGPWQGLEIDRDCRIVISDNGGSGVIHPGNIAVLHQEVQGRTREGWHPYNDGIFGLQRAMAYAGQREWITVSTFRGAHASLGALLCFGLLIEKGDHYANAEHAEGIDKIRSLFARSGRGKESGAEEIARKVRTTHDKRGRHNPPRFGLTHRALQRRAAKIAEQANMNVMWANRLGLFATQLIGDCEIVVDEVLLALRQALCAPWMDGRTLPRRLENAQKMHWPQLAERLQLLVVHPLVQKAQRAAGRIRDAISATTPEERMAHLEAAYRIVLNLKFRLIIGDLQRVSGLMEHRLVPSDAREYLRIASTIATLRDPMGDFQEIFLGLSGPLSGCARSASEQDAETLRGHLRHIAISLDAV